MDHDATREALELAAVEPSGIERLMAGDTAAAQAVAAHLAGCEACTEELARLQQASALIGGSLREMPSPDLKARTLSAIRGQGVIRPLPTAVPRATAMAAGPAVAAVVVGRGGAAEASPAAASPAAVSPAAPLTTFPATAAPLDTTGTAAVAGPPTPIRGRVLPTLGWVAALAAAVALSVVATSLVVGSRVDEQLARQQAAIAALEHVTTSTLAVTAQSDAEHVALVGTDPKFGGSLVYSPSSTELVVVATGLAPPSQGVEYGCWVEIDGTRERVGKMFFSGDLAYWIGPAPAISKVPDGATFGVSLVGSAGQPVDTTPVLVGAL
ncbi:MAG: hypothetical protein ABJC39_00470 [Chloroflexota bacterium]